MPKTRQPIVLVMQILLIALTAILISDAVRAIVHLSAIGADNLDENAFLIQSIPAVLKIMLAYAPISSYRWLKKDVDDSERQLKILQEKFDALKKQLDTQK